MSLCGFSLLFLCLLVLSCLPSEPTVTRPSHFSDLQYDTAIRKYKALMEKRYEGKDKSYVLSLLDYAVTNLYGGRTDTAKQAFTAGYKVDDGRIPEAAKFYQWLQVDSRKVYRLTKRERELCHFYLGLCYLFEDDLEESLVEFKKLRQRDQEASMLPLVNFYMGLVYEKQGLYDDALLEYRALEEMYWVNSSRFSASVPNFPGAPGLVERVERLQREGGFLPNAGRESDRVELVVHVDHQFYPSTGRTEVYADGELVATMPPYVDNFAVRLSEAEASREALQKASAEATRAGIRCCGTLLAHHFFGEGGAEVVDLTADIALGDERDDKDPRLWPYATAAVSLVRTEIPAAASELKLVFHARNGGRSGSCVYPLSGEHARVHSAAGMYFLLAGLAEEFYVY